MAGDTIDTSTVVKVAAGAVFSLLTGGAIWWMSSVHTHLESIDTHIVQLAKFQGGVERFMQRTDERLLKLEDYHGPTP